VNSTINQALVFCFAVIKRDILCQQFCRVEKSGNRFPKPNDIITLGIVLIEGLIFKKVGKKNM
jgi:hypothetical protein